MQTIPADSLQRECKLVPPVLEGASLLLSTANICKINDTLRRIDTTRQFFVPAAIEKSRNRAGCGRIFSLRRIIYFYPLIYFNGRSEDDSVHRRRNSTNFGERHSAAEWGLPAGIAQRIEPPPRNIVGIGMQRSIRTRCLAAQPPSGLRRFGKTKPRTRNRNPGPPSPPRRGGQHVSPQYGQNEKAASKRKIAVSPYNGSGLPDDLQAAPPIRLSGRNLTEIRRQRLRYISS